MDNLTAERNILTEQLKEAERTQFGKCDGDDELDSFMN